MPNPTEFLVRHGYAVVFLTVLAEQLGLPVPAVPVLLAAGALAGLGRLSLTEALALAAIASLIGDAVWFYLGRSRGTSLLTFLCRISLEPESCISTTRTAYLRYGPRSLLFAKFIPGLSTVAPPMAGMFRLRLWKFLALDLTGSLLWASAYIGLGWMFRTELEWIGSALQQFGIGLVVVAIAALCAYLAVKYIQRKRVYRALRVARILPGELKRMLDSGEDLLVVDLRNALERQEGTIPGSIHLAGDDVDEHFARRANVRVVLFCSCPDEYSAAKAAMAIRRLGFGQVHPLEGGFAAWRELGFPVEAGDDVPNAAASPVRPA